MDCQNPASPEWIKRFAWGIPDGFRYDFSEYFQNETNTKNRMRLLPALHTFGKTNTKAAHFFKTNECPRNSILSVMQSCKYNILSVTRYRTF